MHLSLRLKPCVRFNPFRLNEEAVSLSRLTKSVIRHQNAITPLYPHIKLIKTRGRSALSGRVGGSVAQSDLHVSRNSFCD